jgi:hypothetical protein
VLTSDAPPAARRVRLCRQPADKLGKAASAGVDHPVKLFILLNGTEYLVADYLIEERPQWAKPK